MQGKVPSPTIYSNRQRVLLILLYVTVALAGIICFLLTLIPVFNFYFSIAFPCAAYVPAGANLAFVVWIARRTKRISRGEMHGRSDVSIALLALFVIVVGNFLYLKAITTGF